jgi:hypothetical protein
MYRAAVSCLLQSNKALHIPLHLQVQDLETLKLRYDTADNLRLRKILDPSKPQHAAVLASIGSAAGSSSAAGELTSLHVQRGAVALMARPGCC